MLRTSLRAIVRLGSKGVAAAAVSLLFAVPAAAQFDSGSSGVHGQFPPTVLPNGTFYIVWNMTTGFLRYCNTYDTTVRPTTCASEVGNAQIPGIPAGGLQTGIYEFTNVNIVSINNNNFLDIYLVGNPLNNPITILSQGDIRLGNFVRFRASGMIGRSPSGANIAFSQAGGDPGPGGAGGAAGGIGGSTPSSGNPGFGAAGGAGGDANATTVTGLRGVGAGSSPASFSLTPLRGGSGGGGGAGLAPNVTVGTTNCGTNILGYGGAGGGGGGGGVLMAATNEIFLGNTSTTIDASGGGGGDNTSTSCRPSAGGGEGGSVRLVTRTLSGAGLIDVSGGNGPFGGTANGAGGRVRLEANTNAYTGSISGASSGSFTQFPNAAFPANIPTLRIASIGGIVVPTSPTGNWATPDISFATAPTNPVTVALTASQIPVGTTISLRVTPAIGVATTTTSSALTGTLSNSTASASVTIPPGPGSIAASATFTLPPGSAMLLGIPNLDGTKPHLVEVVAGVGGESKTYVIAENGARFELGLR
jgi:hypothetical protein